MMKRLGWVISVVCIAQLLFVSTPYIHAGVTATSAVEIVNQTFNDGSTYMYKYTVTLDWDNSDGGTDMSGLSYFDLNLTNSLLCPYSLYDVDGEDTGAIRFEDLATYQVDSNGDGVIDALDDTYSYNSGIDGHTNSEVAPLDEQSVIWFGTTDTDLQVENNHVRFEQALLTAAGQPDGPAYPDPGAVGTGVFWFYSDFAPVVDVVAGVTLKSSTDALVTADLTGALPYCVPEPMTMALLGFGGLLLSRKR